MSQISKIKKRNGRIVKFDIKKIEAAIHKAIVAIEAKDGKRAVFLAKKVVILAEKRTKAGEMMTVEKIQDIVEEVLIKQGDITTAKAYIIYRQQHKDIREVKKLLDETAIVEDYLSGSDWRVRENSNMSYSLQGLNVHISYHIIANYWLSKIFSPEIAKAHKKGDFHIHDLGTLGVYCVGWDLEDILKVGFKGVPWKLETKPAKHFSTALMHCVNFMYTMQGEAAGAIAFSNFDTLLAPFVWYDKLDYKTIKQALQVFIFNMNVPTRVGFQCVSDDTEILTPGGWKGYKELKKGDIIRTYNLKTKKIEDQKTISIFKKNYKGIMYQLQNRIQDQLISPGHKVVRRKFNTDRCVLESIEDVLKLKSPFIIPVAGENINKEANISDEQIKLMAWIISEGTIDRSKKYRSCHRVSIYQSMIKNRKNYNEIINLLKHFKLNYSKSRTSSLGQNVERMRLNAESSRIIHQWFGSKENIHFIPDCLLDLSERQSRLFLTTYLKADGSEGCKISTTEMKLLDNLQIIVVNSGYGFTVLKRNPTIGTKDIFVLRIIRHKETYISKVQKIDYEGIIWCPHTKNETIIARRNGKVFITGNTPFTNVTLDLQPPKYMKDMSVIIGGKLQKKQYKDFQKEMDLFNQAFSEVLGEGDANGKPFTFPIPTYNLSKDFDWDNPNLKSIWEMTAKYGIPYFANFINSDMNPEDARSMCCRLRLDNRELRKRGGGLFGSNPLTGSIGVVTINLPRIGYLAKNEKDFFTRLVKLMDLAKNALEIKRKTLEYFTEKGLYPYSAFYLRNLKQATGKYWKNHFSTIGIIGMNEAILNFMGKNLGDEDAIQFAQKILDFMREKLADYQEKTGEIFNLEATPAEGASYSLARIDKKRYPKMKIHQRGKEESYYTNSTQLPVGFTDDIFEALDLQDGLQIKYTGGTVLHGFLGERMPSVTSVKKLVKKIAENYSLPYFTLTPNFSICEKHGYISGEHLYCPQCQQEGKRTKCEIYSRVVGYLRPVSQWNAGKQQEFKDRKTYDKQLKSC